MNKFTIKEIINPDMPKELDNIGFDKSYFEKAAQKYQYKNLKIFGLTLPQANILKQTAISVGADCAVHREVITSNVENTDCILGASVSQIKKIVQKLRCQPFSLQKLAQEIENNINFKLSSLTIKNKVFDYKKPYIVGVLNLTKDSFSDGGTYFEFENACKRLLELIEEGADIVEIGAESTKPFSTGVEDELQLEKLLPILDYIKAMEISIPISVDTRSAYVAQKCVEAGADIINDVSGFSYDSNMAKTVAKLGVAVIIQHSYSNPEDMQVNPVYESLMDEIFLDLKQKTDLAISLGVKPENIIIDAGIGFGKTQEHNFEIINRVNELSSLGFAQMLGVSRKNFLGMKEESNEIKDVFSLALNSLVIERGVNFLRVHNVALNRRLVDLFCAGKFIK